jgi:hypothetical protein
MAKTAFRWSGIFLMVGASLQGVATVTLAMKPVMYQPLSPGVSLLFLLAAIFLLLSLPAVYARQANRAGWLGLVGHGLLETGILLWIVLAAPPLAYPSLNLVPGENALFFFLGIALTAGFLLTGIATIRAAVFPRWAGILLLAATFGFFFSFFVAEFLPPAAGQISSATFALLLALALAWLGLALWTTSELGPASGKESHQGIRNMVKWGS